MVSGHKMTKACDVHHVKVPHEGAMKELLDLDGLA